MIKLIARRNEHKNFKKVLSSALTFMLLAQAVMPGVFVNTAFAEENVNHPEAQNEGDNSKKVNICHRTSSESNPWNAITVSENAQGAHLGHVQNGEDYLVSDEELGESEFDESYCVSHSPNPDPTPTIDTGSLTVTKVVVNHGGGTMQVSNFPLEVNGMDITSGVASTSIKVGSYTVTETGHADYVATFSGGCDSNGNVNVTKDQSSTCTITNTFDGDSGTGGDPEPQTGKLTVKKIVENAGGGTAVSGDFMISVTGSSAANPSSFNGNGGTGTEVSVTNGVSYTVSETSNPNYTAIFSGDCNSSGVVVGGNEFHPKTCTITNTFNGVHGGGDEDGTATLNATKIVCNSETDLPNWSGSEVNITSTTASDYVNSHPNCHLEPNWQFQWAPSGTPDPGMAFTGSAGNPWTTFGASASITIPSDNFVWVREVLPTGYIPFTSTAGGAPNNNVSAEFYCDSDVLNYDNYDFVENLEDGEVYNCVGFNVRADDGVGGDGEVDDGMATLSATKIVCPSESDLPNWAGSSMTIGATTAAEFIASHPQCHLESDWKFQTVYRGEGNLVVGSDPGGSFEGEAGSPWVTIPGSTNASGNITTSFDVDNVWHIWVREVLKDGFLKFSSPEDGYPGSSVSAEMYCHDDVLNYDNYELINGTQIGPNQYEKLEAGKTYHCIAFNVPEQTSNPQEERGTLIVQKVVINDNGGTASTSDFSFQMNGGAAVSFEIDGQNNLVVATGTHSIVEVAATGYNVSYLGCSNVSILNGETKTCVITNDDIATTTPVITEGGQGGDNNSSGGGSNRRRGGGSSNNNNNDDDNDEVVEGTVLGVSTFIPNNPLGEVLGIATSLPGLPNTGFGPIDFTKTDRSSTLPVIIIGLLALSGLYLVQFRLLKK
ncbi:MAG: hypothetical protein M3Q24_00270 [bacterium]|nr:hypothetical protein [bacterium]